MHANLILVYLSLFVWACMPQTQKDVSRPHQPQVLSIEIPHVSYEKGEVVYDNKTSSWSLNGHCYSGYVEAYYPDGTVRERFGVFEGRKQNQALVWYPDGHLKFESNYHLGKLDGEKKMWSADPEHILLSHLNYRAGKAHGIQKKWYPTGELFKVLNLNQGREEGPQKAYRKNGALFANYEAKNGRIFGLKKAALCFGLEDEEVQYLDN